jgi:hypothetical protein
VASKKDPTALIAAQRIASFIIVPFLRVLIGLFDGRSYYASHAVHNRPPAIEAPEIKK